MAASWELPLIGALVDLLPGPKGAVTIFTVPKKFCGEGAGFTKAQVLPGALLAGFVVADSEQFTDAWWNAAKPERLICNNAYIYNEAYCLSWRGEEFEVLGYWHFDSEPIAPLLSAVIPDEQMYNYWALWVPHSMRATWRQWAASLLALAAAQRRRVRLPPELLELVWGEFVP